MDPLQELPLAKWPSLQEELKEKWPTNIGGFYALHVNLKYPQLREAFHFKVYCPYGDVKNGFVATNIKGDTMYIMIYPTSRGTNKLDEALDKTKIIDWTKTIEVDLVTSPVLKTVNSIIKPLLGLRRVVHAYPMKSYYLGKTTEPYEEERCPSETYLSPVRQGDIERVDNAWRYKHAASYHYYATLASNGLSYGLYSRTNDKLIAWIFLNDYNYLSHLYCESEHRRRGYGEYLMKYVINDQLRQGNDVYAFVTYSNEKSSALFDKLGFTNVDDTLFFYSPAVKQSNKL